MTVDVADVPALPPGTRFGELEILGTLGVGGFGIVYLARDHALERDVAIKEYMPSQFALRDGRSHVSVRSVSMQDTFELGRRSFVNEARLLARFDHPSLLKVYRFWEANGTAYMAMPRLLGQNLREARRSQATPPPEAWARRVFDAVLGGLEALHAQQVWHRDVAPDNIWLPADGSPPILLDFGAARQAIGDRTQVFTAILKPSFAPIEQYADAASLKQGPWTDFYALAAVMHELLTGRPPPPCTVRAMGDELATLAVPGYPPAFLAGLDWALRLPPHQRPQTAAAWRAVLDGHEPVPPALPAPPRTQPPPLAPEPADAGEGVDIEFSDTVQAPVELPPAAAPAPRRRWPLWAGAAGAAVLLLGLFVTQLPRGPAPPVAALPPEALPASAPEMVASAAALAPAASLPPSAPVPASVAMRAPAAPLSPPPVVRPAPTPRRDIVTEKAGEFRPTPPSTIPSAPAVVAPTAATTSPTVQAQPPAAEPRTPAEACGDRVLLVRAWCIDRQCEKARFANDPECVKLRELRSGQGAVP